MGFVCVDDVAAVSWLHNVLGSTPPACHLLLRYSSFSLPLSLSAHLAHMCLASMPVKRRHFLHIFQLWFVPFLPLSCSLCLSLLHSCTLYIYIYLALSLLFSLFAREFYNFCICEYFMQIYVNFSLALRVCVCVCPARAFIESACETVSQPVL